MQIAVFFVFAQLKIFLIELFYFKGENNERYYL